MNKKQALISVNLAVFLFATAAPIAKGFQLPSIGITFGRVFFSSITLLLFCLITRQDIRVKKKSHLALLLVCGLVLALHWWTFLGSAQISTVAISTITFSTFPLFVTFLEPFVFHERLCKENVITAIIVLIGVFITIPEFTLANQMSRGILVGMISSLSYAVLTVLNRFLSGQYQSTVVSLYEQGTAAISLAPIVLTMSLRPTGRELGLLLFLGIATTALAHTIFINSLKHISAGLAGIIASMESVYGIIIALAVLGEVPSAREIIGAVIIIGAVVFAQTRKQAK